MLNRLNNNNGKGSNAVTNKQIKELQADVAQLRTDVDQQDIDIASIESALDEKVSKAEQAIEVDTALVKADTVKVDFIDSKDESDITVNKPVTVNGNVSGQEASFTKVSVNGVDIVDDLNSKVSCAITDASNAACTANDAVSCADCTQSELNSYKAAQALETNTVAANIGTANVTYSTSTESLTVRSCAEINELTAQVVKAKAELMNAFIEPTEKDATDFYQFHLPAGFNGKARFVGTDESGEVLFSAVIDATFSSTGSNDREGTALVIHSGLTKYDFYQVLRRKDIDQISFITQSNIKRLSYSYENYDKEDEPSYDIWTNLTDNGPDYTLYNTKYTAEHSDQVIVFGNEDTLNGGLTVFGTFQATAFEVPESEVTNVFVKNQIHGGYECETGEYTTQGTSGGVITYNQRELSGECNVSWINGCPRQIVRKGVCYDKDAYDNECSYLTFETVETKDTSTGIYNPDDNSDKLFDEAGLAAYNGVTCAGNYPINHLGDNTCVHGRIQTAGDIRAQGQIVSEDDVVVHGDLFVDGTTHIVDTEEVQSSGDYQILRAGQPTGITSYAGTIIENYDGTDKHVFIGVDCCGEVRVGKNAQTAVATYTDISDYNSQYYDHLTQTTTTGPSGYMTNVDAAELDNVVYNSTTGNEIVPGYYHWEGVHYYGPLTIVSGKFDLGNIVTDASDIATLDALAQRRLVYYNSVTDNVLADIDINQPVLTRNESGNLSSNALLQWDATNRRADAINMPVNDKTVLSACVVGGNVDHYEWTDEIAKANGTNHCDQYCLNYFTADVNLQVLLTNANVNPTPATAQEGRSANCPFTFNPRTGVVCAAEFCGHFSGAVSFDDVYPVGTVYMNYCRTTIPFSQGTWCPLNNTFLRATTTQSCVSCTGGADTKTLAVCNLPAHCHSITNHCHSGTVGSHAHCVNLGTTDRSGTTYACWQIRVPVKSGDNTCVLWTPDTYGNAYICSANAEITYERCNDGFQAARKYRICVNQSHTHSVVGTTCGCQPSFTGGGMCSSVNTGNTGNGCSFDIKPYYTNVAMWYRRA